MTRPKSKKPEAALTPEIIVELTRQEAAALVLAGRYAIGTLGESQPQVTVALLTGIPKLRMEVDAVDAAQKSA